jgi:hypothetical protein
MGQAWVGLVLAAATLSADSPAPSTAADAKPATAERPADSPGKSGANSTKGAAPRTKEEPAAARPRDLADLAAPADTILVICREIKDALSLVPEGVFLTPEKYRALLDRIDQLERQAKAAKPEIPSACKLTGKLAGDLVQFQAQFDFRTDRPRAQVALGCQRAWLKPGATLDGQLPLLLTGEDGQVLVQVEKPGVHQVSLELELPLAMRGVKNLERGFDLGLPRAAITTLDQFSLPRSVAEVRVNGRTLRTRAGDGAARLEGIALGPVDHLDLTWKGPTSAPQKGAPLLEAKGQIGVRVTEAAVLTDVELSLQVVGGETREWRIQMPPQVLPEVREPRLHDERIDSIDFPDEKNRVLRIRLKEASTEPLKVVFQVRQPRARGSMAVGLFPVLGALKQRGTITVSAPAELRLRFTPRADVLQRDIAEESRRDNTVAEFSYGNLPTSIHPAPPTQAPLEIQVEQVKGVVEARVEHSLLFAEDGWRITTKAFVAPVRTRVSQLEVELPAGFQYDRAVGATPAELVDSVDIPEDVGKTRTAVVKLIKEQTQPFTVSLAGVYALAPGARSQTLELPRPLQLQDRGGQVAVVLPEGMELTATSSMPDSPVPGERQHTWRFERFPTRVELAWQPHRPDLPAANVIDVTVAGTKVQVRQRVSLPIGPTTPKQVTLVIPESVSGRLRLTEGGTLEPGGTVKLTPTTGKEQILEWTYSFSLEAVGEPREEGAGPNPAAGGRYQLPLVRVAEATHADTRLRVWTDPGIWPVLAGGPWEEQPTEVVANRDSLPALVLHSGSLHYPLTLVLKEQTGLPVAPVVIDHALIQAAVAAGGGQSYRVRFLVSRLNTRNLDIEFPAPLALLTPELFLDGKKITRLQALPAGGQGNEAGSVLRLPIEPGLVRKPTLLEVRYRMTPALAKGGSQWLTTLTPPVPRGEVLLGRVRWQVELPPGEVPIYQVGGQPSEQRWLWLRGLVLPRPAATNADLERWLTAGTAAAANGRESPTNGDDLRASLGCWQTVLRPVDVIHAPNQLWLFVCSALVLGLGLGLTYAPLSRWQLGAIVIGLGVAVTAAAVGRPGVVPAVLYGSEPGLVVLLVILAVRWMLQRRYRRQVVFMPGFTRLKTGSSLVRRDSNNRARGEPSTVDAPTKRDSSAKQRVEES